MNLSLPVEMTTILENLRVRSCGLAEILQFGEAPVYRLDEENTPPSLPPTSYPPDQLNFSICRPAKNPRGPGDGEESSSVTMEAPSFFKAQAWNC